MLLARVIDFFSCLLFLYVHGSFVLRKVRDGEHLCWRDTFASERWFCSSEPQLFSSWTSPEKKEPDVSLLWVFSFFLFFPSCILSFFFFLCNLACSTQMKNWICPLVSLLFFLKFSPSGIYAWDRLIFSERVPLKFVTWRNSQQSPFCW